MDDNSGLSMIRFIWRKSEAYELVKEMILEIESVFNEETALVTFVRRKTVTWLRSDGGGGYLAA